MRVIFVIYAQKRNILCIYIILLHIYARPLPGRAALNMHDMQAALPLFRRSFRLFGPASIRKARAGFGPNILTFSFSYAMVSMQSKKTVLFLHPISENSEYKSEGP